MKPKSTILVPAVAVRRGSGFDFHPKPGTERPGYTPGKPKITDSGRLMVELVRNPLDTTAFAGDPLESPSFAGDPLSTTAFVGDPLELPGFAGDPLDMPGFAGDPLDMPGFAGDPSDTKAFVGDPGHEIG